MKLLNAVNLILPKLGERPVTSVETRHPTLAIMLPILEQVRKTTLKRGWWFNEYPTTLYPNSEGQVDVGTNYLSFVPDDVFAAVRGQRLFNTQTASFVFTAPIKGRLTEDIEFELLPESAAQYVFYSAMVETYITDIGMTQEVQAWQSLAQLGWSDLIAEHMRQRKHTTRNSRAWRSYVQALNA